MVEKYLQVEQLRFKERLTYSLVVDDHIDIKRMKIPTQLIQPNVENAIWHGLMHKKDSGHVSIKINQIENQLHFLIEVNGVGRKLAKINSASSHKSTGMTINIQRLKLVEVIFKRPVKLIIEDLKNKDGAANGTRVKLTILIIDSLNPMNLPFYELIVINWQSNSPSADSFHVKFENLLVHSSSIFRITVKISYRYINLNHRYNINYPFSFYSITLKVQHYYFHSKKKNIMRMIFKDTNNLAPDVIHKQTSNYIYFQTVPKLFYNTTYNWTVAVGYYVFVNNSTTTKAWDPPSDSTLTVSYGQEFLQKVFSDAETRSKKLVEIDMEVYPNPTRSSDVSIFISRNQLSNLKVYNTSGQLHYEKANIQKDTLLKIENLSPGTYFIRLQDNNQIINKKLIVI